MPGPERPKFHDFIRRHAHLLLTTHVNPDGDGLGSEVAMALWLEAQGKTVRILNDSPVPMPFGFLVDMHAIEEFTPESADRAMTEADGLIVLDTSNRQRIGRLAPMLDQHILPIAVVDHHVSHADGFGQVNVIEPEASATGEIVYHLIREANGEVTRDIAEALYVGHRHGLVPLLEHGQPRPSHGRRAARARHRPAQDPRPGERTRDARPAAVLR